MEVCESKMEMNDSDMSLSEWQIVSSEDDKEFPKEKDAEESMVVYSSENTNEDVPKGSSVEDVLEEHLEEEEPPQCGSSCSSSDIDIIDESSLDYSHSNISLSSIELSVSSSFEKMSASLPTVRESTPQPAADNVLLPQPAADNVLLPQPAADNVLQPDRPPRSTVNSCLIFVLVVVVAIFMRIRDERISTVDEMEKCIITLQEENRNLRIQMISNVGDDDKPLISLEEQIKALKGENSKLSKFMQDLIQQLEEKTITFKKESEIRGTEAYQNEINKLKEQVNILQIDNDELQNQLVRMRYGIYSPQGQDPQSPESSHKTESSDEKDESLIDNSTEVLSEEIKELRQKLHSEVEKLKNWQESIQSLVKELENRPKESDKSQEYGDKNKASKKNKENRYDGSFKDSTSHSEEMLKQIPSFNITDLVFRYIGVDKKKVKDVFESVGHYFKKAQSKTKEIFDENVKNDMWNFIGEFRKQWHMLKKAYFPKHDKKNQASGGSVYKPHFEEKYSEKSDRSHKKDSSFQSKHGDKYRQQAEQDKGSKMSHDNRHFDTKEEFKREQSARVQENSKWQTYDQNSENLAETTASLDSWLFERATHRSEVRDKKKDINWYLKNRKEVDTFEYDNLEQDEPTGDPYENIDLFAMD